VPFGPIGGWIVERERRLGERLQIDQDWLVASGDDVLGMEVVGPQQV
jgi:hypothetical protein